MKFLIVEDVAPTRKMLRKALNNLGYTDIIEADNGLAALKLLKERPDIALIDWKMPQMDGLTLIQNIRDVNNEMSIIMVTSEAEAARVRQAISTGVNGYIIKPFTTDTLKEKIDHVMDQKKASAR